MEESFKKEGYNLLTSGVFIRITLLLLTASIAYIIYLLATKPFFNLSVIDDSQVMKNFTAGSFNGKEVLLVSWDWDRKDGGIWRFMDNKYEKIPGVSIPSFVYKNELLASDGNIWLIGSSGGLYYIRDNTLRDITSMLPYGLKITSVSYIPETNTWLIGGYESDANTKGVLFSTTSPSSKSSYADLSKKLEDKITFIQFAAWNGKQLLIGGSGLVSADKNLDNFVKLDPIDQSPLLSALWAKDRYIVVGSEKIFETVDGSSYEDLSSKINVRNGFSSMAWNGTTLFLNSNYSLVSYDGSNVVDLRTLLKNFYGGVQAVVASDTEVFVGGEEGTNRIVIGRLLKFIKKIKTI